MVTHRRVATSIVASGIVALSKLAVASPATAQTDSNVTTPTGDDALLGATEAQVNTYRAQGFRIIDVDRIASNSTEECRGALSPDLVVMSCGQALDLLVYIDHMSEPEVFALIASLVVGIIGWGLLAVRGAAVDRRLWSTPDGRMRPGGGFGCLATIFAWFSIGAVVFYVLLNFAASDVKPDAKYIVLYLVMGYAFAAVNTIALRVYGWKVPDMFERRNRAAHTLFYTATLASVCAYAGANIGDGPGFYVVIYCAALAHLGLYTLVVVHAALNRTVYRILVDRDRGIAFRAGCMFVAIGAVLGRAVAGNWAGFEAATGDFFRLGWPTFLFVVADTIVARVALSREIDGNLWVDRATGIVYLLAAAGYIFILGAPV